MKIANHRGNVLASCLLVIGCVDGTPQSSGDGDDGGLIDVGTPDIGTPDVGGTDSAPEFPEGSYHYVAAWISVGGQGGAFDTAFVMNLFFSDGELTIEYRDCFEEYPEETYRLEPVGDDFEVVSASGEPVVFQGVPRDEFLLHVSDPCNVEFTMDHGESVFMGRLDVGRVCVVDWCDDFDPATDRILVDYCEGEPQLECEEQ